MLPSVVAKRRWVTIAHDFDTAFVGPSTNCFLDFCNARFPILRPCTNSVLYGRSQFFLLRRQLQRGFCQINPHVGKVIPVRCI